MNAFTFAMHVCQITYAAISFRYSDILLPGQMAAKRPWGQLIFLFIGLLFLEYVGQRPVFTAISPVALAFTGVEGRRRGAILEVPVKTVGSTRSMKARKVSEAAALPREILFYPTIHTSPYCSSRCNGASFREYADLQSPLFCP